MTFGLSACVLVITAMGCSGNSKVLQQLDEQRAAMEKQQQVIAEMSKSMKEIEEQHRLSLAALSAKDAENKELAVKLETAEARIERVAQRVEHEVRHPTFTVEKPEITIQRAPPPTPVPARKSVDLIINSVSVYGTQDNGDVWDESGPPDLKVRVETSSDSFTTATTKDSESASYDVKSIRVAEGDTLVVTVIDDDAFSDDEIGSYSKLITADTLSQGSVTWSFGRVSNIVLKFER